MGHNIFVSYKYSDNQVQALGGNSEATVRNYVDILEKKLPERTHHYRGEHDNEDLSDMEESTIWEKLKDKIFHTSVTIVLVSKGMVDSGKSEREQWIPWEISFSLRKSTRNDACSQPNSLLAVVLPDTDGNYDYFVAPCQCAEFSCSRYKLSRQFNMISQNMFNKKNSVKIPCLHGNHWDNDSSYFVVARWDEFCNNLDYNIKEASKRKIEDYNMTVNIPESSLS